MCFIGHAPARVIIKLIMIDIITYHVSISYQVVLMSVLSRMQCECTVSVAWAIATSHCTKAEYIIQFTYHLQRALCGIFIWHGLHVSIKRVFLKSKAETSKRCVLGAIYLYSDIYKNTKKEKDMSSEWKRVFEGGKRDPSGKPGCGRGKDSRSSRSAYCCKGSKGLQARRRHCGTLQAQDICYDDSKMEWFTRAQKRSADALESTASKSASESSPKRSKGGKESKGDKKVSQTSTIGTVIAQTALLVTLMVWMGKLP